MTNPPRVSLSPIAEGLVGTLIGAVLGGALYLGGVISPLGILGVAAGVGLGSWFNAKRRAAKSEETGND